MKKKAILAYSGGLDTSFCAVHLSRDLALEVHAVIVNSGGFEEEGLLAHATEMGDYLRQELEAHAGAVEIRGRGLMIGIKYDFPIKEIRDRLLTEYHIFVGNASDPSVLKLLPPLNITKAEVDRFLGALYALVAVAA